MEAGRRYHFYICGSPGAWDEYNPFYVISQKNVSKVLNLIIEAPLKFNQIVEKTGLSESNVFDAIEKLRKIDAVKILGNVVMPNFVVLFKKDIFMIKEATKSHALKLAERIIEIWDTIKDKLLKVKCTEIVGLRKVAFAVIGAYALDLTGVQILLEEDLAVCGEKKPGDRYYTLYARESFRNYKKLIDSIFWGCHRAVDNELGFYSFGDHSGTRFAIPDRSLKDELKVDVEEKILRLIAYNLMLKSIKGELSIDADDGFGGRLIEILVDMSYLKVEGEKLRLNYPLFLEEDGDLIESVVDTLKPAIRKTAIEGYRLMEKELADITPLKRGYSLKTIYNEVWHWIFGRANKILAKKGYLYYPPKKRPQEGRYMPWIQKFKGSDRHKL